ncbi:mediator of RNA polymerase II transcription subunit 19a-like isoform X2 [Mercurialis annua]|uniref:mediator of RNA polymerase II transcription subunit 19a-like isoform X2 n=1 Tax=Mercurialis annua TaxID=3986 RepID=UPI002160EEF2|nr:mediator of RNA polymerase II transcription subunit 19a-like isoform X2 [Mercurialis annua]
MDFEGKKFGSGVRELCGAVDLVNQFKLWPHHEYFCKRSLPLSVSGTHYLQNVVGDTEIRKGEGMELDQLFQNTLYMRERKAHMHTFDLGVLSEAFQMRETTPVSLPCAEKGIPTNDSLKLEERILRMHKKHKKKNKDKDRTKHKHNNEDGSNNNKHRKRSGVELGPSIMKQQHDKRRRQNKL